MHDGTSFVFARSVTRENGLRTHSTLLRSALVAVALLTGTALAACSNGAGANSSGAGGSSTTRSGANAFPVTIHAANGRIEIPVRPTAIVSLSPTATEMLYAIGAGSQVKDVDEDSDYPPQAPHTSLDGVEPNVEAILVYHPDLVVVAGDSTGLAIQFAAVGVPVLSEPPAGSLKVAYEQFEQLGAATGHSSQAETEVAHIQSQIASIVHSAPKPAAPATYYYELDQTYYSVTSSTFVGQLLGLLGLKNIADTASGAASSGGYPQLSAEFIVKANPQYVFLADTICCQQNATTVAARPGWSSLRAVRNGHVIALNDDVASRWGPRIVDLLRAVADGLTTKLPAAA
jgi:iron complex transport system substrate-binding protein